MARALSELTLDEVVAVLIGGEAVALADRSELTLDNADSRTLLAFYNRDRSSYWNPDKDTAIREGEIDKLLEALERPYIAPPLPRAVAQGLQRWRLIKIEAHRFRGLHRHCGDQGRDPKPFVHDVAGDVTLFRGFNGAGKTSLLNAVCWCLTGVGYHAQALPSSPHDLIDVQVQPDDGQPGATPATFKMPPLVPIPTDEELALTGGEPKVDTWVRLTFRSLVAPTRVVEVERKLQKTPKGKLEVPVSGLEDLGLGDLALQAGTTMPAIAAAMRFGDKTSLSQAVATLTGLRPLAAFGSRCENVHDRLTDKFTKAATTERDNAAADVRNQIITLQDLVEAHSGVPALGMVMVPDLAAPDAWKQGIANAKQALDTAEAATKTDAELLLGVLPRHSNDADIQRFVADIDAATALIGGTALKALPSWDKAVKLGQLAEDVLAAAETQIASVVDEARQVHHSLADKRRAGRIRLYALVAKWHEEHYPGQAIHACPVCGTELVDGADVPPDALLDMEVVTALENCRAADAAALKTAKEWERDKAREFVTQLPDGLRAFATSALPQTALQLYGDALAKELFSTDMDMPQSMRPLAKNVASIWSSAIAGAAPMPNAYDTDLPDDIPNNEGLRNNLVNIERAIRIARYRTANSEFIRQAIKRTLNEMQDLDELGVAQKPLKEQLAILKRFAQSSTSFRAVRRQVVQIDTNCQIWAAKLERIGKLARAATAIQPFMALPALVHQQVGGLIEHLNSRATHWATLIYRPQFNGAPSYAGLDPDHADTFMLLATNGKHRVAAHHIMNASALRAFLWSFVLALWEQIWARSGGISCLLMDDAQDLLDPANVANMAAAIPKILEAGINPLVASNDFAFLASVENHVRAGNGRAGAPQVDAWEFSAISRSKATATMTPLLDEVRERFRRWQTNENDPELSRQFAYPVRVRIETKLWDLLGDDPVVLQDPTLHDLMGRISTMRRNGEVPFNEEPFRRLVELPCLQPGASFRDVINKAHHGRADQVTPGEAAIVAEHHDIVLKAIDACWTTYARHMRRLPPEEGDLSAGAKAPAPPAAITFTNTNFPIIGNLAAHGIGTALVDLEAATASFQLETLGDIALYTLRANTLGMVALQGQTLIVSLSEQPRHGDLAVVQTAGRTYARRIGIDRRDPSRIALETLQSTANVPPTHFVMQATSRVLKIIGVLFDNTQSGHGQDEAILTDVSQIIKQVTGVAQVVGDSAFPLANDGHHVLIGPAGPLDALVGRIVAVIAHDDPDFPQRRGFLKRLSKPMPGHRNIHYLENVGLFGEGEYVQFPVNATLVPGVPLVDQIWRVHGVLFR
ncbi:ATP-binding protein [Nitrospirillum amazonense]|uniref:ATP-binding protein n=1 Tax=Nitrospirillum amazonense TaxID=28077 RepID=UPI00241217BE|nr:ATP-binding protein [Nitrospirillum amazonense]MDG3442872.1 ATP-binding protein [Nitrospirillum amazonense]